MPIINGMIRAASALHYWERRQEVSANNLANAETTGFKAERVFGRLVGDAVTVADTATDRRAGTIRETGAPLVPAVWKEISTMTIAFGHGLSITGLQLARAYAAVTGDGLLRPVTVLKVPPGIHPTGERVVSQETAYKMQGMLRLVVERGTGKNANAQGYLVGGKTGTAEKAIGGGYHKKTLVSSFVSIFPVINPRYVVLVMIDEPKGNAKTYGYATAGWTAAPTTKRVIERIAPMLGVPPSSEPTHPVTRQIEDYIQPEIRS